MQNRLQHYAASCRILYSLYYASPTANWLGEISTSKVIDYWPQTNTEMATTREKISHSLAHDSHDTIQQDHQRLFKGLGTMLAYPWGSVYTDRDGLLMGETAQAFKAFCLELGIELKLPNQQPWDHIGLQLDVLATLLDSNDTNAIRSLLGEHMMIWVPTFLNHVNRSATTGFYNGFAELTQSLLTQLVDLFEVDILPIPVYASISPHNEQVAS
ncbi:TorD/DmsD family molecular chaperone [Shewanella waksmanii]|uniref:TorD/DmsD family molecular chaperone n=1 Tax=Shewanella waksmanii TaxID=213783 RepID=UPI0004B984BA|nr:molecular chaperone TorD family protein [Shewanella waksmanii]